jgi:hypothetical protein
MMTRKHFQQVANMLNSRLDTCRVIIDGVIIPGLVYPEKQGEYDMIMFLADEFADWFSEDNPSFDRDRFMNAVTR